MSVFTSLVTEICTVPGDPGQTITIRKLAPKHLEAAAKAAQRRARAEMAELQRSEALMAQLAELLAHQAQAPAVAQALADPLHTHDALTVIEHGVIAWSYERERTREAFEDLDEDTQTWLARAVLRLAKPALFQTPAEREGERKND